MRPLVFFPAVNRPSYPNDPRHTQHHHRQHHHPPATRPSTTTARPYQPYTDRPARPTTRPTKHWQSGRQSPHATPKPRKTKPDNCYTTYDAISMIRRELFIFRGQFLWRIGDRGLYPGYPTEARRLWNALPDNFTKIDAVYENAAGKIVFFIARLYYVFDSVSLEPGYPQPLTTLGLPSYLTHIDAAFVWGHNNRTYLLSDTVYWRLDEEVGRVELDYPRDMSIWGNVPYNIDAAFQYTDRKTYFFKDRGYWEFNDDRMMVAHKHPKLSARRWMKCPRRVNEVDEEQTFTSPLISERNDTQDANADSGALAAGRSGLVLALLLGALHLVLTT